MASPYKAPTKVRETFRQITQKLSHNDLRRGQIVYILVFYSIPFSWLFPPDGFQFNFLLRDSENDLYFNCPVEVFCLFVRFVFVVFLLRPLWIRVRIDVQ